MPPRSGHSGPGTAQLNPHPPPASASNGPSAPRPPPRRRRRRGRRASPRPPAPVPRARRAHPNLTNSSLAPIASGQRDQLFLHQVSLAHPHQSRNHPHQQQNLGLFGEMMKVGNAPIYGSSAATAGMFKWQMGNARSGYVCFYALNLQQQHIKQGGFGPKLHQQFSLNGFQQRLDNLISVGPRTHSNHQTNAIKMAPQLPQIQHQPREPYQIQKPPTPTQHQFQQMVPMKIINADNNRQIYKTSQSPFIPNEHQMEFNVLAPYTQTKIRVIRLRRKGTAPLGFSIRGGCEHGTGIFVSDIQQGTEAERQGLKVGDQIMRINGFNIDHAIHEEVLSLLRSKPGVVLKVKSVGMIPIKDKKKDPITWKIVDAKRTPNGSLIDGTNLYSSSSSYEDFAESEVTISAIGASGIGCTIVKGPPDFPGIFVQTVKLDGLAELSGLDVGDQIIDMNGYPFLAIDFSEAVSLMKSSKELKLLVRKGAGMDLFPDEKARRVSALLNGVAHTTKESPDLSKQTFPLRDNQKDDNRNGSSSPNQNGINNNNSKTILADVNIRQVPIPPPVPPLHSRQDSVSTVGTSATSTPSVTTTTTTGSERDYSMSETEDLVDRSNSEDTHVNGLNSERQMNGNGLSTDLKKEEEWIIQERKILEEEQKKLKEESKKIAEERRQLEEMKKSQMNPTTNGITPPPPMMMMMLPMSHPPSPASTKNFLAELQQKQLNPISNVNRQSSDSEKYKEEIVKRQQHEKLMQEFQQMHKRMFGAPGTVEFKPRSEPKPIPPATECFTMAHTRRQRSNEASFPPPPPSPVPRSTSQPNLELLKEKGAEREPEVFEIVKEDFELEPSHHLLLADEPRAPGLSRRGSLYVPPLSTNPHMFVDPVTVKSVPQVVLTETRRISSAVPVTRPVLVNPTPPIPIPQPSAPISIPSKSSPAITMASSPQSNSLVGSPLASSPPISPPTRLNGKDVPITDSRGPAPKPPQTYFDRPAKGPLVTIGVYPDNSRTNRFTVQEGVVVGPRRGSHRPRNFESGSSSPTSTLSSASGGPFNKPLFSVSMTSSSQGSVSSNASSVTSSPTALKKDANNPGQTNNPVSFKINVNSVAVNKKPTPATNGVTNSNTNNGNTNGTSNGSSNGNVNGNGIVPKMTAALNGKANDLPKETPKNGLPEPKLLHPTLKKKTGTGVFDPYKQFTEEQIAGKDLKIINVAKTGTLNMKVEGGINSELGGRIVVSEVWPGGCIPNSAGICRGDQIMMVDERKIVDVSLTLANAILRDAVASKKETLRLVIAKENTKKSS